MDKKKIDFIASGVIVFIFLFAYFVLFSPEAEKIVNLKEKEKVLSEKLNTASDTKFEMKKISEEIERIQGNLEDFEQRLPGEKRIYDFVRTIDRLAQRNDVELEDLVPGDLEKRRLYSRVPITISAEAGFRDFYRFLYELEQVPRITKVEGLEVTRSSKGTLGNPEAKRCEIQMSLTVYVGGG
jgi:Tfp pilus assembly protein PilO